MPFAVLSHRPEFDVAARVTNFSMKNGRRQSCWPLVLDDGTPRRASSSFQAITHALAAAGPQAP